MVRVTGGNYWKIRCTQSRFATERKQPRCTRKQAKEKKGGPEGGGTNGTQEQTGPGNLQKGIRAASSLGLGVQWPDRQSLQDTIKNVDE